MNKKGDYKYDVALALILGLLIVALVFYFLYAKYFTQEDIDWQTCSQSVSLRSGNFMNIIKEGQEASFPFKCKTEVVEIDFKDYEKAGKLIMNTIAQCKALFLDQEGDPLALYSVDFIKKKSMCFHCARIHFSDDVKDYYGLQYRPNKIEETKNYALSQSDVIEKQKEMDEAKKLLDESDDIAEAEYTEAFHAYEEASRNLGDNIETMTTEEFEKESQKVQELKKKTDEIASKHAPIIEPLKAKYDALLSEYVGLLVNHMKDFLNTQFISFDWRFYLTKPMGDTGMTYGQYIYDFKESGAYLANDAFSYSGFPSGIRDYTKNVVYSDYFDSEKGDLLITVVYTKWAFNLGLGLFDENTYFQVVPHQTSQPIICSKTETVPA